MAAKWIELVTGSLDQKKQWRQYVARIDALPAPYRDSAKALQRYLLHAGGMTDGETLVSYIGTVGMAHDISTTLDVAAMLHTKRR